MGYPAKSAPKLHTVKAWSANAIAFIEAEGLTRQFSDWCGGWPCPVSPEMVQAAPDLLAALKLLRSFGCPHCGGDCGSANPPVTNCPMAIASSAIARAEGGAA